jgi:hypothetical protein
MAVILFVFFRVYIHVREAKRDESQPLQRRL